MLKRGTMMYLAALYLSFCYPQEEAVAEELVLSEKMQLGVPSLLCDKVEDVIEVMGLVELSGNLQESVEQVEGCGWLKTVAFVKVVAIGTFETDKNKYLLVRFEFLEANIPPQYSIGAIKKITKT